ncbi:unnamed protein product [Cuscuta campestris]|uniref:Uncharacterized protein n=1 Tax=Cuscuta campestris TaxID=132261 RepID=A0A484KSR8_9ASTE|nr:unnamed protein product [Cuscuta campestris]
MGRTPCCEKVGLNKGRWTREEDERLVKYIQQHGEGSWRSLPNNAGLQRCGKSCRLRWINYLRSDLKRGNFTAAEEETIVKLHTSLGNRWSTIASHLPGRTDNEIKNYWNSHLSRRIYSFRFIRNGHAPPLSDTAAAAASRRRRAGRVSRSVAKKYNTPSHPTAASNKCGPQLSKTPDPTASWQPPPACPAGTGGGFDEDPAVIKAECPRGGCGDATAAEMYTCQIPAAGDSVFYGDEEWVNWIIDNDDDGFGGYDEIWEGLDDLVLWPWDNDPNNNTTTSS